MSRTGRVQVLLKHEGEGTERVPWVSMQNYFNKYGFERAASENTLLPGNAVYNFNNCCGLILHFVTGHINEIEII